MAAEHDPNDDLYSYDGYDKATFGFLIEPDVRQPRQDSGVDIQMPEAIHNEAVGTLFASQAATDIPSQATTHIAPRQTINAETQTQHGSESSVFACYDAIAETKRGDTHHTIFELRRWLGRFKLPQAARADDKGDFTVENEASHHLFRQRSLSAQAAKLAASEFPLQRLADDSIDGNESATHKPEDDDAGPSIMDERLNLLLSIALPQSPIERTCEWDERQRAREEYDSIERAHAIRLEADQRSAQTRERNLEISENNWKEAEVDRKRAESSWPNGSLEASVVQELEHGDELASQMSSMINYMDSGLYIIPRMWDFTDPTRRTRLYSNTYSFLRYMMRERKVVYLLGTRFEDLQQGRSNQPEAAITEEMKTLENAMEVRCNAEVDYFNLLCDFLNWAIAHTTLEFRDMTNGGPEPTRPNALTNDIPISVVEDMIEVEAELMKRYERLRDLEQAYFPKRFIVDPLPSEPPPTQTKPQYTPRGRQIPVRQQMPPQDDSADEYDLGDEAQFGERLTRTLPRPFRPQNTPLLRVMRFDPHPVPTLDKKMTGEPTSPVKPPETDYLRPPKQKRKLPLRMLNYPHTIEEYTPESLSPFKPWNLTTARVRHKSQTGIGVSERTLRRSTLQKQFVSLDRVKRERALREPWTPDNIDRVIECNWREDLRYMQRCRSLAEYNTIRKYWRVVRELSSRAGTYWVAPTHIGRSQWHDDDNVYTDDSEGVLRLVIPDPSGIDPSEDFRDMLDADDFKRAEDQIFFDAFEDQTTVVRSENPDVPAQDPAVRVIDFASRGNTNNARYIDSTHLIEHINDIDDPRTKKPSLLAREIFEWYSDAPQESNKGLEVTVIESEDYATEADVVEGTPADHVGLFQRPITRLERRIEDQSEVKVIEIESFDSDVLEKVEPKMFAEGGTSEAQDSSVVEAGTAGEKTGGTGPGNTEPDNTRSPVEDDQSPTQQLDPVASPPSRAQQLIERQPELMPKEIGSYDTEEEDLERRSLSETRRINHTS